MKTRAWLKLFVAAAAVAWNVASAKAQESGPIAVEADTALYDPFAAEFESWVDSVFQSPPADGYYAPEATVGSLIALPNLQTPASVSVVTRDLIRDQQALSFNDILRDISGAVQTNSGLGAANEAVHPDSFALRGLEVTRFNFRKNGFLDPTFTPRDFANVERVEVLKGPASALYGAAQPSGTVNVITKQAVADRFAWGGVTFGSFNLQRYQFDANSMNEAGDLLVRVSGAYQDVNSFRNFGYNERTFVAPTVTKLIGDSTVLTWAGEYLEDHRLRDSGLIAVNGDARAFPAETLFSAPTDFANFRDLRSTLSLQHTFDNDWELYVGGHSVFYDAPSIGTVPQTGFTTALSPAGFYTGAPGIGGLVNRTQNTANVSEQSHGAIAKLAGDLDGPRFTHKLLIGAEANWLVANNNQFTTSIPGLDPALTIDPNSGAQPFPGATPTTGSFGFNAPGYYQNRFGLFGQDIVELTDRWSLVGGVRWDTVQVKYDRSLTFGGFPIFTPPTSDETFDQISPRAGVVYELLPDEVSLYALYTRSFSPPNRTIFASTPLLAETGDMFEGGIKMQLASNLAFTAAAFHIERNNVATQITNFNVDFAANQRSRGVEFDLVGQCTERLSTSANYTYADVEQNGPAGFTAANGRVRGVPFGTGNVWGRYNLIQENELTLGLGLGYVYVGERRGDYATPLRLAAYDRWDLGVFGRYGRWDMTAYVENVFNERYEVASISQYQIYPGAPLNFRLQVGAMF